MRIEVIIKDEHYWRRARRNWLVAGVIVLGLAGANGWRAYDRWCWAASWENNLQSRTDRPPEMDARFRRVGREARVDAGMRLVGVLLSCVGAVFCIRHSCRLTGRILQAQGRCVRCRYDLRGLSEPRCPECGTPFDRPLAPGEPQGTPPAEG
jgi:hypothetical protein